MWKWMTWSFMLSHSLGAEYWTKNTHELPTFVEYHEEKSTKQNLMEFMNGMIKLLNQYFTTWWICVVE